MMYPSLILYSLTKWSCSGRKQTKSALNTKGECNIDNKLQAVLPLLSLLAVVVHLKPALYDITSAYMHRRQVINRATKQPIAK